MKTRKDYLDALKLFAIFVVFATHFIEAYRDSLFLLWKEMPWAILLKGISGKFGVAIFSVILGYFAYRSSEKNVLKYAVKRYIYFLICALFINGIYACLGHFGLWYDPFTLKEVLITSIKLGDDIFPTFWCIIPFFAGSVLSRINGRIGKGAILPLAETVILIALGQEWIAICLMGNLAVIIESNDKLMAPFSKRAFRILVYIAAFAAIKQPVADIRYPIDGLAVVLVILALSKSTSLAKFLSCKALSSPGRNTMAIYLIHVVVYRFIGDYIIDASSSLSMFLISLAVSWVAVLLLSYPVNSLLNSLNKVIGGQIDRLFKKRKAEAS